MKKIHKKLLLTAAVFSAAMNMNGCGTYGPPDDRSYEPETEIQMESESGLEEQETEE